MQYLTFFVTTALITLSCGNGDQITADNYEITEKVLQLKSTYAPDRRTDRVEVTLTTAVAGPDTLTGYTTLPEVDYRLDSLALAEELINRVRLLPAREGTDGYGLIRTSVANIRTEAGHSQELTSQALMGTPVQLLDYQDGWYLIRTPDRYIAWLEEGAIALKTAAELEAWFHGGDLRTCVPAQSVVMREAGREGKIVSELVAGSLITVSGTAENGYLPVILPDGRTGYVNARDLRPYAELSTPQALSEENLLSTAHALEGRPYLWGGTSTKGMDCSGFTKTAYYLNGYVIPRDASQQVKTGTDVTLDDEFTQLRRGDLLFFGNLRENGSERITHVGFYLGEGRMLHAGADNDYITENSLIAGTENFAPHRLASLLRARRLRRGSKGVVRIDSAFQQLYTRSSSR